MQFAVSSTITARSRRRPTGLCRERRPTGSKRSTCFLRHRNSVQRNRYLFDTDWPNLPEGKWRATGAHEDAIGPARQAALRVVLASEQVDGIVRLAIEAAMPSLVGDAAEALGLDADAEVRLLDRALGTADAWGSSFARGYLVPRTWRHGWGLAERLLAGAQQEPWAPDRLLRLLFALPESARLWDEVVRLGEAVHQRYWSEINGLFVRDVDEAERAVEQLLHAGRPQMAYEAARFRLAELPGPVVATLLRAVATTDGPASSSFRLQSYDIEKAFEAIDGSADVSADVTMGLEWTFFEFLEHGKRQPRALYQGLAEDPGMFLTLLQWAFRPTRTERSASGEEVQPQMAERAYRVLDCWKRIPGSSTDGTIDRSSLEEWVEQARQLSRESDRLEICENRIGHMLSSAPIGEDRAWPAEPVRDIIEGVASDALDDGFRIGVYNARGATWRRARCGGGQERELAEKYRRCGQPDSWPLASDRRDPAPDCRRLQNRRVGAGT